MFLLRQAVPSKCLPTLCFPSSLPFCVFCEFLFFLLLLAIATASFLAEKPQGFKKKFCTKQEHGMPTDTVLLIIGKRRKTVPTSTQYFLHKTHTRKYMIPFSGNEKQNKTKNEHKTHFCSNSRRPVLASTRCTSSNSTAFLAPSLQSENASRVHPRRCLRSSLLAQSLFLIVSVGKQKRKSGQRKTTVVSISSRRVAQ